MGTLIAMGVSGLTSICLVFGYWILAEERPSTLRWYKAANFIAGVVLFIIVYFFSPRDESDPVTAFCLILLIGCMTVVAGSIVFTTGHNDDHDHQGS